MKTFLEIIKEAIGAGANAVYFVAGQPITYKYGAEYRRANDSILMPDDTAALVGQAYNMIRRQLPGADGGRDDLFALSVPGFSRMRVTVFSQRNSCAMAVRVIPFTLPQPETMHIPEEIMRLSELQEGLVLVCGPAESGKSTTLTCLLNAINNERFCHILTLENPIEYLIPNRKSFLSQRELELDTGSLAAGLRTARSLAPDVLYVSDAGEAEAYPTLLEVADNGRLVLAGMRAGTQLSAVSSILNQFSGAELRRTASLLSQVLRMLVFQRLVTGPDGVRRPEFRLLEPDTAIRRAIESGDVAVLRAVFPEE